MLRRCGRATMETSSSTSTSRSPTSISPTNSCSSWVLGISSRIAGSGSISTRPATRSARCERPMPKLRVHNLAISLDGFGSGEGQSLETPFGHAGTRLMQWFFPTATFQGMSGDRERQPVDPSTEADDRYARRTLDGIGAEIMGARKFGPPGWQDDPEWQGGGGGGTP